MKTQRDQKKFVDKFNTDDPLENTDWGYGIELDALHNLTSRELINGYSWNNLSSIKTNVDWFWNNWIPYGYVTMLVGESGIGKSTLLLRLAGCVTEGWDLPDGSPYTGVKGLVLWCEGEASQALNLERASKMGINSRSMLSLFTDPIQDFDMEENSHNRQLAAMASREEVKLIVIDSFSGVHAGDENSAEMNRNINFLAKIARDTGKPIIITHHLRKKSQFEKNAVGIDRVRGSSAIVQCARSVIAIDQPDLRSPVKRIISIKSNLSAKPDPIGFRIADQGITFEKAPIQIIAKSELEKSREFLEKVLKDGPVDADVVNQKAVEAGLSKRTLDTAKNSLGVKSNRIGGSDGKWQWELPDPNEPRSIPF